MKKRFDMSKSNGLSSKPPRTASKEQTKLPNILRLDDNDSEDVNNGNSTGGAKSQSNVKNDTKSLVDKLVNLNTE